MKRPKLEEFETNCSECGGYESPVTSKANKYFDYLEHQNKELIEENLKLKSFWEWFSGKYNRFKCFGFKSTKDRDAYEQKYNELVKPIYTTWIKTNKK